MSPGMKRDRKISLLVRWHSFQFNHGSSNAGIFGAKEMFPLQRICYSTKNYCRVKGDNGTRRTMYTLTAVLHKEDDMYVAECPEVGTVSQGHTIEEAVNNLKEATELYLVEFPLDKDRRSIITTFEVVPAAKT